MCWKGSVGGKSLYPPTCPGAKMEIPASGSLPRKEEAFAGILQGLSEILLTPAGKKSTPQLGIRLLLSPQARRLPAPFRKR
jgi:hypothetical protein